MKTHQRIYKAKGIVLKRMNYGESDRIITIFTKEFGKVKTIAKGVRKITSKRSGHLEIFTNAQFTLYEGKTFDYITEVQAIDQFEAFRKDLGKASFAYYLCEIVDYLLPERQEHGEIYDQLHSSFSALCGSLSDAEKHGEIYRFALDTLWLLGFLPGQQTIPAASMTGFIENLIERRLKTVKLLEMV